MQLAWDAFPIICWLNTRLVKSSADEMNMTAIMNMASEGYFAVFIPCCFTLFEVWLIVGSLYFILWGFLTHFLTLLKNVLLTRNYSGGQNY